MARLADILRTERVPAWLSAINATVFMLVTISLIIAHAHGDMVSRLCLLLELPCTWQGWLYRPWTLLTYMFTHEEFLHLLFNVLWLLWFGAILRERVRGSYIVWLYLGGGVSGGLLYMALMPVVPAMYAGAPLLLGASASVLALMSAAAVLMPRYELHLFFIGDVKLKWIALAMILLAFVGLGGGNAGGQIAHIGGVVYGLVAALILRYREHHTAAPVRVKRRNPFKGQPRIDTGQLRATPHDAAAGEQQRMQRLDELLDKIHTSGYNSLTRAERAELTELSNKVGK